MSGPGTRDSVFISYSRKDKDLIVPVIRAQEVLEYSAFIDYENTPPGVNWEEAHMEKINYAARFILCWSKDSALSPHVEREWRLALESQTIIIPVIIDNTPLPQDLSHLNGIDVREYVQEKCRPTSHRASLVGGCLIGIGATIGLYQLYLVNEYGFSFGRIMIFIVAGLCSYIGWCIVSRWLDWLRLKKFVDNAVIRDLQEGYRTGTVSSGGRSKKG